MIAFVVALREEARPLCERLALRAVPGAAPFTRFTGDDAVLVLSGVGKLNAAAAVAWLAGLCVATPPRVWINAGVAGHPQLAPGELRVAHRIRDATNARCWYPPQSLLAGAPGCGLVTVSVPETRYTEDTLYDMEAAGFYAFATRCTSAETVQSVKVVSDNRADPATQLSGARIEALMRTRAEDIIALAQRVHGAASALPAADDPAFGELLTRAHFSVAQRRRLARLLQRHRALAPQREVLDGALLSAGNAREILRALEHRVSALPAVLA